MSWLAVSIVALWVVVFALLVMNVLLFRQLGIMVLGTARGIDQSGFPIGRRIPSVSMDLLAGGQWQPSDWIDRPYLLVFASPTCRECKALIPRLAAVTRQSTVDVALVLISDQARAREYAENLALPDNTAVVSDDLAQSFDVEAVPFAYAVDQRGAIVAKGLLNSRSRINSMVSGLRGAPFSLVEERTTSTAEQPDGHQAVLVEDPFADHPHDDVLVTDGERQPATGGRSG